MEFDGEICVLYEHEHISISVSVIYSHDSH